MSRAVTLDLPDDLAELAGRTAARSQRSVESVLVDWLRQAGDEPAVLADEPLLALCEAEMPADRSAELGELLERQREGGLDPAGRARLDRLMEEHRRGLLRKAKALKAAVERGLRPAES